MKQRRCCRRRPPPAAANSNGSASLLRVIVVLVALLPLQRSTSVVQALAVASNKNNKNLVQRPKIQESTQWHPRSFLPNLPPHAGYHGALARPHQPFFEGWYLRLVLPPSSSTTTTTTSSDDDDDGGNNNNKNTATTTSTTATTTTSMAFIYHVFDPHITDSQRRGVGLQTIIKSTTTDPAAAAADITPTLTSSTTTPNTSNNNDNNNNSMMMSMNFAVDERDLYRFTADSSALYIRNLFRGTGDFFELSSRAAKGRITTTTSTTTSTTNEQSTTSVLQFSFDIRPVLGWGGGPQDAQFSTAGWLAALPIFEPHYQVLISKGYATGSVVMVQSAPKVNDDEKQPQPPQQQQQQRFDFVNATVYLEKNWGESFPSKWWWIQANTGFTDNTDLTVTSTGALRRVPSLGVNAEEEEVALIALHYKGEFLPFPEVTWNVSRWGQWNVQGSYKGYSVQLTGRTTTKGDEGFPVACPTLTGMQEIALETFAGTLRVELYHQGRLVLNATTTEACLEVGGLPAWNQKGSASSSYYWQGTSRMAEPLKSIVMNEQLERLGSNFISFASQFVKIPGL